MTYRFLSLVFCALLLMGCLGAPRPPAASAPTATTSHEAQPPSSPGVLPPDREESLEQLPQITEAGQIEACQTPPSRQGASTDLHLNVSYMPQVIDPMLAEVDMDVVFATLNVLPLLSYDSHMQLQTAAAEQYTVSPDGLHYEVTLRPNLHYSDGTPILAAHYVAALKRLAEPTIPVTYRDRGRPIAGFTAFTDAPTTTTTIERDRLWEAIAVHAPTTRTLTIDLAAPTPRFIHLLAHRVTGPVHPAWAPLDAKTRWYEASTPPVGSGAFHLVSWTTDQVIWERNPFFALADPEPGISRLVFSVFPSRDVTLNAYCRGLLDILSIDRYDEDVLARIPRLKEEQRVVPGRCVSVVSYQARLPPFHDIRLRQAFSQSIDRRVWATIRVSPDPEEPTPQPLSRAFQQPSLVLIPSGFPGHIAPAQAFDYDPAAAQALFAQLRYSPKTLTPAAYLIDIPAQRAQWRWLAEQWKTTLGITVEYFAGAHTQVEHEMKAGDARHPDLVFQYVCAESPDPAEFLVPFGPPPNGGYAFPWHNERLDALLTTADHTLDEAKRLALYGEAQDVIIQEQPVAILGSTLDVALVQPWVQGFGQMPLEPFPGLSTIPQIRIQEHAK